MAQYILGHNAPRTPTGQDTEVSRNRNGEQAPARPTQPPNAEQQHVMQNNLLIGFNAQRPVRRRLDFDAEMQESTDHRPATIENSR